MSAGLLWTDVAAWSAQVFILSSAACLLPRLLRITEPKSRLIGAQLALLACALFPLLQPRSNGGAPVNFNTSDGLDRAAGKRMPSPRGVPWQWVLLGALPAGAALRLILLGAGLWKLRSYRTSQRTLESLPLPVSEAFALTQTKCRVAISDGIHGPATFGLFHPIVLLPPKFSELPEEMQRAIACHELLHVRRKDWAAALTEECIGALLWFQPAVYLLIADIRLAREKAVDRLVVDLTLAKAPYVQALLTVASAPVGAEMSIAPLFLHRRNLKSRVKFLIEELSMSRTKLIFANVSLAALLGTAGWVSMVSFPITAAAQEAGKQNRGNEKSSPSAEKDDLDFSKAFPPATGERVRVGANVQAANLISQVHPVYPSAAKAARIQGAVKLGILVGTDGQVHDVALISGDPALAPTAADAVRQWVYRPTLLNGEPVEVVTRVDVNFTLEK